MPAFSPLAMTLAAAGLALNLAAPARADDARPLPTADRLAVGLDDAIARSRQSYPATLVVDAEVARHGSRWVYLVRSARNSTVRLMKIDCATGAVIVDRREGPRGRRLDDIRREARQLGTLPVSRLEATRAAEATIPGARAYEVEFDDLNNAPVFKVKLLDGARRVEVLVDARTGRVLGTPGDGVATLSFEEAAARAASLFPGWRVVKVEFEREGFDDGGDQYGIRLIRNDGLQRRDVRLHADTGVVLRDRIRNGNGGGDDDGPIGGPAPTITYTQAALIASAAFPGSVVREVELEFEHGQTFYKVELIGLDGLRRDVFVNSATGQIVGNPSGGGDNDDDDDNSGPS